MTESDDGSGLDLDPSVRTFGEGTVLVGGHPGRLIVLSRLGAGALRAWLGGDRPSTATRRLGRRLVVAGMAHPVAPEPDRAEVRDVTVVVPARDRTGSLDRCLGSLGPGVPTVVVDDGSEHPEALAEVCARHGATLIRRAVNGGPGAARNEVQAWMKIKGASELMAPAQVVVLDEIPLLGSGKVDYIRLAEVLRSKAA